MTVTTTDPTSYSEARHIVHASVVSGAPLYPILEIGDDVYVTPRSVTADFCCRTQLGQDSWTLTSIKIAGFWVDADAQRHPRYTAAPSTTLLLDTATAPGWAVDFAHLNVPQVRVVLPGRPKPAAADPLLRAERAMVAAAVTADVDSAATTIVAGVVLGAGSIRTEIRHTVTIAGVTGADPLRVPSDYPGRADRWMRPEDVTLDYHHGSGLFDRHGWRLARLSVTGPWVDHANQIDPHAVGRAQWSQADASPSWLRTVTSDNRPAHGTGLIAA